MDQILKAVLANATVRHLAIGRNFIRLKYLLTNYSVSNYSDL